MATERSDADTTVEESLRSPLSLNHSQPARAVKFKSSYEYVARRVQVGHPVPMMTGHD